MVFMNTQLIDSIVNSIFFVPKNSIDKFGYSIEDYHSMLCIKYLEIIDDNISLNNSLLKPYLYRVAKNIKIDLSRKFHQNYFLDDNDACVYINGYIEAVEVVDILQKKLTQNEYYLLLKWVFKSYNDVELNSDFYRKVHSVLKKAKEFLNGSGN
jgi:hypothetical protein